MPKIDRLLDELVAKKADVLHLSAGSRPLARAPGGKELAPLDGAALERAELDATLHELLTPASKKRLDAELEITFAVSHGKNRRFRASYAYDASGLVATFRAVPAKAPSFAELGCPDIVRRLAERRAGLVLVAGPAGSGKSATLAAMIDHVGESRACHVITVEDPIEIVHEPSKAQVTQREVGAHTASFAAALRSAAREDPQVVMVSELRTADAAALALALAAEGVLVLAGVTANGVIPALERVLAAFPDSERAAARGALGEALEGVVAQQLVVAREAGAAHASGRVAAFEVLVGSSAVAATVRAGEVSELAGVMQNAAAAGNQTMDTALERLLGQGKIAPADAFAASVDKEAFARVVGRTRPDVAEIAS